MAKKQKIQSVEFTALLVLMVFLVIVKVLDTIGFTILGASHSAVISIIITTILAAALVGIFKKKMWGWWTTIIMTMLMLILAILVLPSLFSTLALISMLVEITVIVLCITLKDSFK